MSQRTTQVSALKRWPIALFFVIVALLSGAAPCLAAEQSGQPLLVISSPHYDAGTIWEGETISHHFEVRNEGNAELRILQVKPG